MFRASRLFFGAAVVMAALIASAKVEYDFGAWADLWVPAFAAAIGLILHALGR